jgi:hypothetical protein
LFRCLTPATIVWGYKLLWKNVQSWNATMDGKVIVKKIIPKEMRGLQHPSVILSDTQLI